ncbi:MAG: putative ectoine/hydroxyectoine transporter permease protein EhuD [Hyphomicrobiales bacterium]|nr:putative ectoine/hydroxyectoine transporter permease protein EhuD [Hyphomicrobiales bacterium]
MLFGLQWDTTHGQWAFALSILPILLRGILVTLEATFAGFFIALVLGLRTFQQGAVMVQFAKNPTAPKGILSKNQPWIDRSD